MHGNSAIIFGVGGQDGAYLRDVLARNGITVIGVSRRAGDWVQGSVADPRLVEQMVREHRPRYVFHLAANSTTQHNALLENHETISTGALHILDAVYKYSPTTRFFLAGSGLQFENKGLPIDEGAAWEASSAYAVARIQSVYAARYYRRLGIDTYVGYLFNHDSPRRSERHVSQKIAQAAKRIAAGSKEVLVLGSLEARKEYTFAGDVAEAMWTLVNNPLGVHECVIGSGRAYSILDWVKICFGRMNVEWRGRIELQKDYVPEYKVLVSNPARLKTLGWQPIVDINDLAAMMLA